MALKRASKSIPLTGGIVEDVDDLLLAPPAMQYIENVRFTKKDYAEKSRPLKTGVSTGLTSRTYGLWSRGNQLVTVSGTQLAMSEDAGATFNTAVDQNFQLVGAERLFSTATQVPGSCYTFAPVGTHSAGSYDADYYAVAFERRALDPGFSAGTPDCTVDVVLQVFTESGRLLSETVWEDSSTPYLFPGPTGAFFWFVNGSTVVTGSDIKSYYISASTGALTLLDTEAADAQSYSQLYNSSQQYGALNPGDMRIGYSRDLLRGQGSLVVHNRMDSFLGAIGWKDESSATLYIAQTALGVVGTPVSLGVSDTGDVRYQILDVCIDTDNDYIYVLYAACDVVAHSHALVCAQYDNADPVTFNRAETVDAAGSHSYVNGSVRADSTGDVYIAVTIADGNPTQNISAAFTHRVECFAYEGGDWTSGAPTPITLPQDSFYGYRLVSDLMTARPSTPYMCIQQWFNHNPAAVADDTPAGDPQATPLLVAQKPVSTLLVRLDHSTLDNNPVLVGVFDPMQSKAVMTCMEEQSIHKGGSLHGTYTADDDVHFWVGNRVLDLADDNYFWCSPTAAPAYVSLSDPRSDARRTLAMGAGRLQAYHLHRDVRVNYTNFDDGMMLGAGVPVWMDGSSYLSEVSPLDQPEILNVVSGTGTGLRWIAWADLVVTNEEAKVYQVVFAFYDEQGRIHRSAPSIPIYLGDVMAEGAGTDVTVETIRLRITPPITMGHRPYFVEIYEAYPGETPQLAGSSYLSETQMTGSIYLTVDISLTLEPTNTTNYDVVSSRGSQALYTAGDVLPSDAWPPFRAIVNSGRRLFALSQGSHSVIYYSKTFETGVAPEFSAALAVSLANENITALGAVDDKVILFTKERMWVMYGTGPDNTGANGDFFLEPLPFQVGCEDQQSIVTYNDGIAFYSSNAESFYVVTRDLQVLDIGAPISYLSACITDVQAVLHVPADSELRWYCAATKGTEYLASSEPTGVPFQPPRPFLQNTPEVANGPSWMFVYNYGYQKWTLRTHDVFDNVVVNAGLINNMPAIICDDEKLYVEAETGYWYQSERCKWETPWIQLANLQDFGRVYSVTLLAKYLSSWVDGAGNVEAGDLSVTIKYDYEGADGTEEVHLYRANVDFDPAYGASLQIPVRPARQKCQAIKLIMEEATTTKVELSEPTYDDGQGFALLGMDIEYGLKNTGGPRHRMDPRRMT
jgi:hypothetical protein